MQNYKKSNLIDISALTIAVASVIAVFWTPAIRPFSAKIAGNSLPIVLTVDIRDLSLESYTDFSQRARNEKNVRVFVRNQPTGSLHIKAIYQLPIQSLTSQSIDTQRNFESLNVDDLIHARFILKGKALKTDNGFVIAGTKLKIGVPIVLEGSFYRLKGTVSNINSK